MGATRCAAEAPASERGIGAVARPIGGAGLRRLSEVLLVLLLVRMMRRGLRGELLRCRLIGVEHLRCGAWNGEGLRVWSWLGRAAPLTASYNDCHRDESDDHERSDAADDPGQELAGRQRGGRTVLALDLTTQPVKSVKLTVFLSLSSTSPPSPWVTCPGNVAV